MATKRFRATMLQEGTPIGPVASWKPGVLYAFYAVRVHSPSGDEIASRLTSAAFLCPCGCGSGVMLEFAPDKWSMVVQDDKPTVSPSIRHVDGCLSEYHINAGEVIWDENSPRRNDL